MNPLRALDDQIRGERGAGRSVVIKLPHRLEDHQAAVRSLLRGELGHHPPLDPTVSADGPPDLLCISSEQAAVTLANVLSRDLAYGTSLIPTHRAERLADQVVGALDEASWFTNGAHPPTPGLQLTSWNPLTEATFDTGVIGASDNELVVAWFADED